MGLLGLSGVIFLPILLRQVDAQVMANVLVAQVYVYYLLLVVQFGFNWSSPAALARATNAHEASEVWRTSIRIKVALLICPVLLMLTMSVGWLGAGSVYLFGFGLLLVATAINSNWLLQARLDFSSGVLFAFLGVLASTGFIFLLIQEVVASSELLSGFCVIFILVAPASFLGIGSWWSSRRSCDQVEPQERAAWTWHADAALLWDNMPLVVTQLLQLISATLGTVVVGGLADVHTTNAYASMERLFNLSASVVVALYMASYPQLASLYYDHRARYWAQVGRLLTVSAAVGLACFVLFWVAGSSLLGLYISEPLAVKVTPVMWVFAVWLGLYLSQHVLTGYFVFAQRNGMVLIVNALVLLVTVGVGYPLAQKSPVLWAYGMLAGQAVAVVWLLRQYDQDKNNQ